jgi:predicted RNA-binding protein
MCLSAVYEARDGQEKMVGQFISNLKTEGEKITLTDIMGAETVLNGKIASVDLIKNVIVVEAMEQ